MHTLPEDVTTNPSPAPHFARALFGPYEVILILGPQNEFLGIQGIAISEDFRSQQQRLNALGSHDVGDMYDDESP